MTPSPIGLVGFFGWGNFGDEIFAAQWREVFSGEAQPVNDLLAKPYFTKPAASVASEYSAFVIGGGDLIRTESISQLYWNRAWKRKPIVVAGVGVASESGRARPDVVHRLRDFLEEANIIKFSVRDFASKQWIVENLAPGFEIETVPDLGFATLGLNLPVAAGAPVPVVGLVFNKKIEPSDLHVRRALLELEANGAIQLRQLVLATGVQLQDELSQLRAAGVSENVVIFDSPAGMVAEISSCDYVISAKFHGLVAALANGRMCWSLRQTSKARNLMNLIGLPELVRDRQGIRGIFDTRPQLSQTQLAMISKFGVDAFAELENVRVKLAIATGRT